MTHRTFWVLVTGLWLCEIVAMRELDGLPRVLVTAGLLAVWVGLSVERWRNWQRNR